MMRRVLILLAVLLVQVPVGAETPEAIRYVLRMPAPSSHLFEVTVTARSADGAPLDFQMPAWSPGRYVIHDFARNVQEVAATDAGGQPLAVAKVDKQTWRVTPREPGGVVLSYRVFADDLSGTFSQLNSRHGNVNGASVFVYVVGRKPAPVELAVEPPPGWQVASGASVSFDQTAFAFANYDLLVDTPIEVAPDFEVRTFTADGCEYRVVMHHLGGDHGSPDRYAADVERIVRAENAVVGMPDDMPRYTFLVHFAPGIEQGDGMEHLASTQLVVTAGLGDSRHYDALLSLTAHEYFHVWNVKRIRPVELGPWDYTRENYTTSLWIAEGLTSYYGDLSLVRSGLFDERRYYEALAAEINTLQNSPGRFAMSLEQSSFDTWFHLATRPRQRTNATRSSVNYYNKGEVVGAMLDLEIRHRTNGQRSLDDVFRLLWRRFFENVPAETYYYAGRGYRSEDFLAAVNEVAGSDFSELFGRYVTGKEEIDYERFLGYAGLHLERERRGPSVEYGVRVDGRGTRVEVRSVKNVGLGAQSGLRQGDTIVSIAGQPATVATARELFERGRFTPTPLVVIRDGRERTLMLREVASTAVFEVEPNESATAEQLALRRGWLGQAQNRAR
jgi:predicted metalloprotease with PDZ domain